MARMARDEEADPTRIPLATPPSNVDEVKPDRRHVRLDPEAFERFKALVDDPPPPTDGLRRLLRRPAPWD